MILTVNVIDRFQEFATIKAFCHLKKKIAYNIQFKKFNKYYLLKEKVPEKYHFYLYTHTEVQHQFLDQIQMLYMLILNTQVDL